MNITRMQIDKLFFKKRVRKRNEQTKFNITSSRLSIMKYKGSNTLDGKQQLT